MEKFKKSYPSKTFRWPKDKRWALAGVVGSGNLEVLVEPDPAKKDAVAFEVETSIPGYKASWLAALKDIAELYHLGGCRLTLHDQGAEPILIKLRVRQALDQLSPKTS